MKFFFLLFAFIVSVSVTAQSSLFERVGLPGTPVYTDLKLAAREPKLVYRLHLRGPIAEKQLKRVSTFHQLEALKLEQNNWSHLPAPFYTLSSLLYLRSEGNPFQELSDSTALPEGLRYLEFSGTAFDTLPRSICQLSGLSLLTLSKNTDTLSFPSTLGSLPFLTEFNLMNLHVDSSLWYITQLTRLEKLTLYNCSLTQIDARISNLSSLQELNLSNNKLQQFPRALTQLQNLKRLTIRDNQLTRLDSRICFMKSLEFLDLRGNPMTEYEVECIKVLLPRCDILFDKK